MLNKKLTTNFNQLIINYMIRKTKINIKNKININKNENLKLFNIVIKPLNFKIYSFYNKNLKFYPIYFKHIFICYFFSIKKHKLKKYKIYNINYNLFSKLNLRMCFKTRKKFKFIKKEKNKKKTIRKTKNIK
jgi:hypothetical protein